MTRILNNHQFRRDICLHQSVIHQLRLFRRNQFISVTVDQQKRRIEIFRDLRVPWQPHVAERDLRTPGGRSDAEKQAKVWDLIIAYRVRGSRLADLDPLEYRPDPLESLDPASYGFTVWDLDRTFLCGGMRGQNVMTLREILAVLRRSYCRRWTIEYMHIVDRQRKHWIRERVEHPERAIEFDKQHRVRILNRLYPSACRSCSAVSVRSICACSDGGKALP